ncbi:tyrosine protein phosphatase [Aquibacillus sp. 3ASR75-11]|uniref:Tyrosine-protein phosphatase n=1 Tax=Terrihalobacillus insolitus TaxID=2950438 RepID=A0A9X3WU83_9BACI|nr:CpsB/CapC family capsule biosynthesis tyrosine phosphatase [Terrihalobacillus insolitus]MDC3423494.1 tyrosine protein phosphatase [Terrihalobacillus insolitus]
MIDIHTHILPGVDNGAKHMEESIAIARESVRQGIDVIIAAPHHMNGKYHNFKDQTLKHVALLNKRVEEENIPVTIIPGQLTKVYGDIGKSIEQNHILELNETTGYLLLELPSSHLPQYTTKLLFDLQIQGFRPIIAHPERNQLLMENANEVYELVKNGSLMQLSTASILGKYGKKVRRFAHQLIEHNLAHFIASEAYDAHGVGLQKARQEIKKVHGNGKANQLLENARFALEGQPVISEEPIRIKKKKVLGLF